MTSNEKDKKQWIKPVIFSLDLKETKGGDDTDFGEDGEYIEYEPSGGT